MADIKDRINELVANFVNEITRLARAAAVDTLASALDGTGGGRATGRGGRGRRGTGGGAAPSLRRSKGAKRPKTEIAEIQARVLKHIQDNPGQRIEQINKVLETRTADLTLPLKKLIADGSITTKGARRATTYLPGSGARKRRSKSSK